MVAERCPNDEHTLKVLVSRIAAGRKTYTRTIRLRCGVCGVEETIEDAILVGLSEATVLPTGVLKHQATGIIEHGLEGARIQTPFFIRQVDHYFELTHWRSYLQECPRWFSDFPKVTAPDWASKGWKEKK